MSSIEFEGENSSPGFKSRSIIGDYTSPKMIRFILKTGIVKNEKAAGAVLVGISVLFFALSILVFFKINYQGKSFEDYREIDKKNWEIFLNGAN